MGQSNDPKERGDLQGQQGVVRKDPQAQPPPKPGVKSRDGVTEIDGGEADKPGQSPHDERTGRQPKD
jgi:hypothetical protein